MPRRLESALDEAERTAHLEDSHDFIDDSPPYLK